MGNIALGICFYSFVFVYNLVTVIYRERERARERQTDRERDRERHRDRERETDRETDRETLAKKELKTSTFSLRSVRKSL